jgi:DnaK suppressor protein
MKHLTGAQRAWLSADLEQRQRSLSARLQAHHGGLSRAEHAHDVLQQDGDDAPQRSGERQVDSALSDLQSSELGWVNAALTRLQSPAGGYGHCRDCAADIPFDRLKAEPWALRCVACQSRAEGAPR